MVVTLESLSEVGTVCPKWRTTLKFHLSFHFTVSHHSLLNRYQREKSKLPETTIFWHTAPTYCLAIYTRDKYVVSTLKRKNYFRIAQDLVWLMSVVGWEKSKGRISHYLQSQLHFKSLEKGTTKDPEWRAKAILRKNKAGGIHNPGFQDILQSCSNQNNMVLAQK